MKIVCISDTHSYHGRMPVLPNGDVLVVAGDITKNGSISDIMLFNEWIGRLSYSHKIVVAGNHDWAFQRNNDTRKLMTNCIYLQDELVAIDGFVFYGSPWQPEFCNWAFNLPRGEAMRRKWDMIPESTDVLITHGPPIGILDKTPYGETCGCEELLKRVQQVKPQLHVFGHIHASRGNITIGNTVFVNASVCTEAYLPTNDAIVIDI